MACLLIMDGELEKDFKRSFRPLFHFIENISPVLNQMTLNSPKLHI